MTRTRSEREVSSSSRSRDPKFPKPRYYTRSRARRNAKLGGKQEGRSNQVDDQMHWERMEVLKPAKKAPGEALDVTSVNFNKETNESHHRTENYDAEDLIIRRGQHFTMTLEFDRKVNPEVDSITLQFAFGSQPKESKGTLLRVNLKLDGSEVEFSPRKWCAKVSGVNGSKVDVDVTPSPNAFVGRYGTFVETMLKGKKDTLSRHEVDDQEFILLFNPWNQHDVVYMSKEEERQEYVLNDHGRIWVGSVWNNCGRPWYFGQFEHPVLEAALSLMDDGEIGDTARSNPVTFVRALSALANSMDDCGVLEGRWSEDFPKDCVKPWKWTGSVKIIKKFHALRKSVQFGQCWVFSGVMTTLLRSLGIPTRSVTNFESAHDTDGSMTIDSHFTEDGEPISHMDDSIWNFHVWNESFFRRLDLPDGYDGWQAHDATPQESSEGVMCCGPAPLKAIKEGHVYLNYDVPFIFSEVNGDKVNWLVLEDGSMMFYDIDDKSVGKIISTKAVGSNDRHDLTNDYKYPEGSEDERRVAAFVNRYSSRSEHNIYSSDVVKDVSFSLKFSESTMIGDVLKTTVKVKSNSKEARSVKGRVSVVSSFYTGVPGKRIKGDQFQIKLDPGQEQDLVLEMTGDDYITKLRPEASVQAYATFSVQETGQRFARTAAFTLRKPDLKFKIPDVVKAKETTVGTVEFTNILPVALTNGNISLEGHSITSMDEFDVSKPIQPNETVSFQFEMSPRRAGLQEVDATFTSDQLNGCDGSIEFRVSSS